MWIYGTIVYSGFCGSEIWYGHVVWVYVAQNAVRSFGLNLSGIEYGTVMGYGSIRYRIRYDHRVWIYPVQNMVLSWSLELYGSEFCTIV